MKVRVKNDIFFLNLFTENSWINGKLVHVNQQFIVLAAVLAVAAANSYKAAEYAPKYEAPKYEEVTYVS